VAASVIVAWRLLKNPNRRHILILSAVGVVTFILLGIQSEPIEDPSLLANFVAGAVAICAMILPGISGSFLLLMLGMYAPVLNSVTERDVANEVAVSLGVSLVWPCSRRSFIMSWPAITTASWPRCSA